MQPYQEEYIANLKEIAKLSASEKSGSRSFCVPYEEVLSDKKHLEQIE